MDKIIFTGPKREALFGKWSRTVKVGDLEYACEVARGKRVRIMYKPRGQNWGWHYHGSVYRVGTNHPPGANRMIWTGRVPGSIGCRGLLKAAGVLKTEDLQSPN